jgi:FixJ family two-component response regulator
MSLTHDSGPEVVCLVDDDASVLKSLGRLLASEGLAVRPFRKPKEFIEYVQTNDARVAVVDIWMDEMSGLEVQAKVAEVSPGTRVIVMTGRDDATAKAEALHLGAVAFFTKPFDDTQFLAAVRSAFAFP